MQAGRLLDAPGAVLLRTIQRQLLTLQTADPPRADPAARERRTFCRPLAVRERDVIALALLSFCERLFQQRDHTIETFVAIRDRGSL